MKNTGLMTVLLTFVLFVSACAPQQDETPVLIESPQIPVTGGTATDAMKETTMTKAPTEAQVVAETEAPGETSSTLGGAANVTLMVNDQGESVPFLVDGQGRSLYVYMNDSQNSGISACIDDCAANWTPLMVTDTAASGEGVDGSLLGTIAREDYSNQVTYNGWPLYYSHLDTGPNEMNGQGYNGVWFHISPSGDPIQQ